MSFIEFSFERFMFGNEHWGSPCAADEVKIYCDLLESLQDSIEALETRGKDEEATLTNVQAVMSSYALEIAMKSLLALDNPEKSVPHKPDLLIISDGLTEETRNSLDRLELTRKVLEVCPEPFYSNRYSMEYDDTRDDEGNKGRRYVVYRASLLRSLVQLISDKLEEPRKALLKPPQA